MALDLAGRVLRSRTLAALTTPHSVDHYLTQLNPMWVAHDVRARIIDVHREVDVEGSAPVVTLTLQPTSTWAGHRPGQHVSVGVELPGARRTTRVFTLSSQSSRPGERFQLTIRAREDVVVAGLERRSVSAYLTGPDALGTIVHLSQAEGDFVLPDAVPEHIVLISGGSGITPVMAMLRSLQTRTHRGRIDFIHFAHTPDHQIFADELELAAHSGNGLNVHTLYPGIGDPYLSPALLERLVPGFTDVPTWVCGPAGLIEATHAAYDGSEALQVEYFQPPRASGVAGGAITFERSGQQVPNDGAVLLDQAEAAGLRPASGCRMGICFSCVATKREGTVRNVLTGEVSSLPDDDIRICVSAAEGDCTIDL